MCVSLLCLEKAAVFHAAFKISNMEMRDDFEGIAEK